MKVSEKIRSIIAFAIDKFGTTPHNNDAYSVELYFQTEIEDGEWYAWLTKPSQRQLDRGELFDDDCASNKLSEEEVGFMSHTPTLMGTLNQLQDRVSAAYGWNNR